MLCFSTPHFQTRCGLAVLNLRKGYGPPFAKNRTSFTTSDASDAENLGAVATLPAAACVPPGTWGNHPQPAVPQNHASPRFGPRRPRVPSLRPRWGNDPPPPGQGPIWATQGPVWQKSPEKQKSHFSFSASLRLETKGTVVSNPHNPPLWGGQAERLPDVVGQHKRRAGLACRLGRLGVVPTGDPRPCTHFCRKERSL